MASPDSEILHVSDTALMVAACRALETARPSGLIRDPFAERLAGPRGMAIAKTMSGIELMCFGIAARTFFLDELVTSAIQNHSISTVLSIGSGLDARPWRLDIPGALRWIEVDFPAMLEYKAGLLPAETAHCRVERLPADITDPAQRSAVFASADSATALMITEGLLMYLPAESVRAVAEDAVRSGGVRHWLLDVTSKAFGQRVHMGSTYQSIQNVRAEGHLDGEQILEVIHNSGWSRDVHRSYATDVRKLPPQRLKELMESLPPMPEPPPSFADDPSGVYLLSR